MLRVEPTKIIIHTPEPRHGAARYVCELVKALACERVNVVLHCPANFEYVEEVSAAGATVTYAGRRDVSRRGWLARVVRNLRFAFQSAWDLFLVTRKGDVVHFQFPVHLPLGFIGVMLVRFRGARVVLTAHDPIPHRWRFGARLHGLELAMLTLLYRSCDEIIVHNQAGKNVLLKDFQVPKDRISVIPHGPMSPAKLVENDPPFDKLRLLVFGSIRENKGIDLAIRAVQELNKDHEHVHLTISGYPQNESERKYWYACKELIEKAPRGIETIERFTPDAELPELIGQHHALLLPYLSFVSDSGVAALALSNRKPILATQAGGLGELLDDCSCGVPILEPSSEGVAKAIRNAMVMGAEKLSEMGEEGKRHLSRFRSWPDIARKTIGVYAATAGNAHLSLATAQSQVTAAPTVSHKRHSSALPSFFIIGPARTGTSWLHKVLSEQAALPAQKETYFFDDNFDKGLSWYRACLGSAMPPKAIGEVAPTYFASVDARERITELIPDAKVACIFRNPVDRVSSLYRLRRAHARIPWTLEEAVERDPELLETSKYATHLKGWQRALGKKNVMVTMYDDLQSDPQNFIDALADFISIPRFTLRVDQLGRTYSSESEKLTYPRSHKLMWIARATADWLVDHHLHTLVTVVKKMGVTSTVLSTKTLFGNVKPETSLKLRQLLRPEIEELESMLDRDLSAWK